VKSKVAAKKWLDGRLMAKSLRTTIQLNLVPNPSETWSRPHKFTLLNFLPLTCHFLAATLDFTSFSQWPSWGLHTFFTTGLD